MSLLEKIEPKLIREAGLFLIAALAVYGLIKSQSCNPVELIRTTQDSVQVNRETNAAMNEVAKELKANTEMMKVFISRGITQMNAQ